MIDSYVALYQSLLASDSRSQSTPASEVFA
jgi:hypothetical protein